MSSLPRARRSTFLSWGAAAVTAAALYTLPVLVVWSLVDPRWVAALAAALLVLVAAALRLWSPLVVLGVALLSALGTIAFWFVVVGSGTCGDSDAASVAEWSVAIPLALALGTWGIRGGRRALWAIPAGWLVAAAAIAALAHLVPGGTGGCLE